MVGRLQRSVSRIVTTAGLISLLADVSERQRMVGGWMDRRESICKASGVDLPPPNLQGNYKGSCLVCLQGTDTGLAFSGHAEWLIAGVEMLGVPKDQSVATVEGFFAEKGAQPGMVLDGEYTMFVRVCAACVERAPANFPSPGVAAFGLPNIKQLS